MAFFNGSKIANVQVNGLVTVDEELSPSSTNPVQNKAISDAVANALKGSAAGGGAVTLEDVCPLEHELGVTVTSRNLFDLGWFEADIAGEFEIVEFNGRRCLKNVPNRECVLKGYVHHHFPAVVTVFQYDAYCAETNANCFCIYNPQGAALQFLNASMDINNWTIRTVYDGGIGSFSLYIYNANTVYLDLDSIMATVENDGSQYTPYINDFSGVSVTRYGRNLFDVGRFEANLADGRWHYVEFNGRRCIKNTPDKDCMLTGYMSLQFPTTIRAFQVDAYCAENAANVFSLFDKTGKTALCYVNASTDINNWTVRAQFGGNDVGWFSLYCSTPYDVYIDLDSIIAVTDTETEPYEPFVSQAATANTDGTVEGVTSLSPTTTLMADDGVIINASYNKDANAVIGGLLERISALETALVNN